jgi:hypothetical protein
MAQPLFPLRCKELFLILFLRISVKPPGAGEAENRRRMFVR